MHLTNLTGLLVLVLADTSFQLHPLVQIWPCLAPNTKMAMAKMPILRFRNGSKQTIRWHRGGCVHFLSTVWLEMWYCLKANHWFKKDMSTSASVGFIDVLSQIKIFSPKKQLPITQDFWHKKNYEILPDLLDLTVTIHNTLLESIPLSLSLPPFIPPTWPPFLTMLTWAICRSSLDRGTSSK